MRKILLNFLVFCFVLIVLSSIGQTPYMVKDIATGTANVTGTAIPNMLAFNNGVIFTANDGINGSELWYSDGTNGGTNMVKDIASGPASGAPAFMFQLGSKIYLTADDGISGREIWCSDGTSSGTSLLKDLIPGSGGIFPLVRLNKGTQVYFTATISAIGNELYISDGTASGTSLLKDIFPGAASSNPNNFIQAGSQVFFVANDGVSGEELWKSDGTATGTQLVKDIKPGSGFSNITMVKTIGNLLFFKADDGVNGTELWRSDGTTAGTFMLKDTNPGSGSISLGNYESCNAKLIFITSTGSNLLWESDGTVSGTISTTTLSCITGSFGYASNFYNYSGDLYFFVSQDYGTFTTPNDTLRLIKLNSTINNATSVGKFNPYCDASIIQIKILQANNNKLLFHESESCTIQNKYFIATFDLMSGVTVISNTDVASYMEEFNSNNPLIPHLNGKWVTLMNDSYGLEFHTIEDTSGVATLLKDINSGTGSCYNIQNDMWYYRNAVYCNKLYFIANDGSTGYELWTTDGTTGGTNLTLDIYPGSNSGLYNWTSPNFFDDQFIQLIGSGDHVFFIANNGVNGYELWAISTCNPIGINEYMKNETVSIYPNPTNDLIQIKTFYEIKTVEVLDLNGRVLKTVLRQNEISLKEFSEGLYLLKITDKNDNATISKTIKN